MKATEQYFPVVLFIMLYKVFLTAIQIKTTEQYFTVVLFIMLYKVFACMPVDEIMKGVRNNF